MKLSYILAGSASVAVLTLAVINTNQIQHLIDPGLTDAKPEAEQAEKKQPTILNDMAAEGIIAPASPPSPAPLVREMTKTKGLGSRKMMARPQLGGIRQGDQRVSSYIARSPDQPVLPQLKPQNRDKFDEVNTSPLKLTQQEPVSTFSVDVDTASYSFMRASINRNVLPPKDSVRRGNDQLFPIRLSRSSQ